MNALKPVGMIGRGMDCGKTSKTVYRRIIKRMGMYRKKNTQGQKDQDPGFSFVHTAKLKHMTE